MQVTAPFATAHEYVEKGLKVFPVAPIGQGPNRQDGKEPFPGSRGFKDATCDPDQIATWWAQHPDANIGLSCADSGLVVVDVDLDLDNPGDRARWDAFIEDRDLPATFMQRTPGGGLHLVYRAADGVGYPGSLSDRHGKIADIKHNGYILLAPSVAQSGRRSKPGAYELVDDRDPVSAPDWLAARQLSQGAKQLNGSLEQLAHDAREARRKETDDRLVTLLETKRNTIKSRDEWLRLGFALHAGYEGTQWELAAHEAYLDFSSRWEAPPGTKPADFRENADQLWRSARANRHGGVFPATAQKILSGLSDRPPADFRPITPSELERQEAEAKPQQIRLSGLAGKIADAVRLASDRKLEVFPEAAALVCMSALAGPRFVIRGPQGLAPLTIYALLLGGTGSGKEAARTASAMVLRAAGRENERLDGIASDKALHRALSEGGGIAGNSRGSRGARVMAIDEGGMHLDAIRSGNNSHQKMLLMMTVRLFGLGLGRLEPHKYADSRNEIPGVDRPRLTMMWTSTPEKFLAATCQEDSESGQLNRFLSFKEEGLAPLREGTVDRDILRIPPQDIIDACRRFPAREAVNIAGSALTGTETDTTVEICDEAKGLHDRFHSGEVEEWRQKGGYEGDSWGRASEYSLRVAGLLALSDAAMEDGINLIEAPVICEQEHMALAIRIVRRAILGVTTIAKDAGKSEIDRLKDKVKSVIRDLADDDGYAPAHAVKKRALRDKGKKVRGDVLDTLIDDGEILSEKRETGGRHGEWLALATKRENEDAS